VVGVIGLLKRESNVFLSIVLYSLNGGRYRKNCSLFPKFQLSWDFTLRLSCFSPDIKLRDINLQFYLFLQPQLKSPVVWDLSAVEKSDRRPAKPKLKNQLGPQALCEVYSDVITSVHCQNRKLFNLFITTIFELLQPCKYM
jgi:hypothetical protein